MLSLLLAPVINRAAKNDNPFIHGAGLILGKIIIPVVTAAAVAVFEDLVFQLQEHYKAFLAQAGLENDFVFTGLILVLSGLIPMRLLAAIAPPRHWIAVLGGICVFLVSSWLMITA